MAKTGIKVTGVKETTRFLRRKRVDIERQVTEGIKNATIFTQGEVKQSIAGRREEKASVDTGRLLNSVDVTIKKDEGAIFSDLEYAKFLEFGTSKLVARKHFANTQNRNKQKIRDIIDTSVKQI